MYSPRMLAMGAFEVACHNGDSVFVDHFSFRVRSFRRARLQKRWYLEEANLQERSERSPSTACLSCSSELPPRTSLTRTRSESTRLSVLLARRIMVSARFRKRVLAQRCVSSRAFVPTRPSCPPWRTAVSRGQHRQHSLRRHHGLLLQPSRRHLLLLSSSYPLRSTWAPSN